MVLWCDPPEGWKYGFPKQIPHKTNDVPAWLIANGYPKELMDSYGAYFVVRYWETPDEPEKV